jgi:uncharacterized lipoprotein NlpE involved in copper resistance
MLIPHLSFAPNSSAIKYASGRRISNGRQWSAVMGKALAIVATLALLGCSNQGQRAEDQYHMVEKANPTPQDLCDAARKVADIYLQAGDLAKYGDWKNTADINCLNAKYTY